MNIHQADKQYTRDQGDLEGSRATDSVEKTYDSLKQAERSPYPNAHE